MSKKGLSPVIATVLLISLVLVLSTIIFLWARAFIPEAISKGGYGRIEDACNNVVFEASYNTGGSITVQNNGNVPLYSIQVGIKKGIGSLEFIEVETPIPVVAGGSRDFYLKDEQVEVSPGDELVIIPILLGETGSGELRAFACGDENARTIQVP